MVLSRAIFASIAIFAIQSVVHAQYISSVTATVSSFEGGYPSAQSLAVTNDDGLTAVSSGVYSMTTNRFVGTYGAMWASTNNRTAAIQFDLSAIKTVNSLHVWNYNETGYTGRGFQRVTIQYSDNATTWKSIPTQFVFAKASGTNDYIGEDINLPFPITARYIRFIGDSNYGDYDGKFGLSKVRFREGGVPTTPATDTSPVFPVDSGIINVKLPPYNAVGNGVTDDTAAIQQAINDWQNTSRIIYLPAGTYLLSNTLKFKHGFDDNGVYQNIVGFSNFRGESEGSVVLRLKDNTFTNCLSPKAVLDAGYNGWSGNSTLPGFIRADWFNNNFGYFTIDIGDGNVGAIGVRFYSNNVGAIRNVTMTSNDSNGFKGLDLGFADQNGPLLAKKISIEGFQTGIDCGNLVNSQVLENIFLYDQHQIGIKNNGQALSIRKLTSISNSTTLNNSLGHTALIDSTIAANEENLSYLSSTPAIINNDTLFARNLLVQGFTTTIRNDYGGTPSVTTPAINEFVSRPVVQLFGNNPKSLNLPISETPETPCDAPSTWANVRNYRLITDDSDSESVVRAMASGAKTIYFPSQQKYYFATPVPITGNVERIEGMHSTFIKAGTGGGFVIQATPTTTAPKVWLENFGQGGGSIDITNGTSKTLVLRNLQDPTLTLTGTGPLYLENVATGALAINGQNVWARQLNIEGTVTKIVNSGGNVSILGIKSEQGGTLIETKNGGKTDLLGGLYYSQQGELNNAFLFLTNNASISASLSEVAFSNNGYFPYFRNLLSETRNGTTRTALYNTIAPTGKGAVGNVLPLYVGYDDPSYLTAPFNVKAVASANAIALTWDAMPRATAYIVKRSTAATGTFTTIASNVTTPSYTDTSAVARTRYYYQVQAIYPSGTSAASTTVTELAGLQYRIDVGASSETGGFSADAYFDSGYTGSAPFDIFDVTGVTNPAPNSVYQTERYNSTFTYTLPGLVANTNYKIRLHFAEFAVNAAGQRVFNVAINGVAKLSNYDIYSKVGKFKVVIEEFTVPADASGTITIAFTNVVANPSVSAIEVLIP